MKLTQKNLYLLLLAVALLLFVFIKNSWVSEDAYILFRSVEQLFAGNGPIWNPHERVQVYTSPLWFLLVAATRIFSANLFINVIVLSLFLWAFTAAVIYKIVKHDHAFLLVALLFLASTGFYDYTTSGLENVLAYFLVACYLKLLWSLEDTAGSKDHSATALQMRLTMMVYGLIICVRHDLSLLLLPVSLYLLISRFKMFKLRQWLVYGFQAFAPLIAYTLFSLVYYGFPFPNTAYAKLNTGIATSEMLVQGLKYFYISLLHDSLTMVVIFAAMLMAIIRPLRPQFRFLGLGIAINLVYVAYVGGDFMLGRFFSYAYLVAVVIAACYYDNLSCDDRKIWVLLLVFAYGLIYPHTPLNSPFTYDDKIIEMGVADERGFYFDKLSLYSYLYSERSQSIFPEHKWAIQGNAFKDSEYAIATLDAVGMFGYFAGLEKVVVDPLALSDPLLARLPVTGDWRIGHFYRELPAGYLDSIFDNSVALADPGLNEFYQKIKIITQSRPLLNFERLKTIALMNLGAYNNLLPGPP